MTHRSVLLFCVLAGATLGVYAFIWLVLTKEELNRRGGNIPSAALVVVPVAGQIWAWRYARAVAHVTEGRVTAVRAVLYLLLLGGIGLALLQAAFNRETPSGEGTIAEQPDV